MILTLKEFSTKSILLFTELFSKLQNHSTFKKTRKHFSYYTYKGFLNKLKFLKYFDSF